MGETLEPVNVLRGCGKVAVKVGPLFQLGFLHHCRVYM